MNKLRRGRLFANPGWWTTSRWFRRCMIRLLNINAAVYDPEQPGWLKLYPDCGKHSIYIFTDSMLGFCILIIDQRFFMSMTPIIYIVVILLLIAVLVVGRNVGGNQAWIPLGSFRLQPSEFGKLATCLLLAYYLNSQANKTPNLKTLF